jgi:aspartyl-tRNA(Asn)/glutamyl-tRNA(Gln) amidotransferase subunit C
MSIQQADILKLAHLARLKMTEEEATAMQADMVKILEFVSQIEAMDLDGVEPLVYLSDRENVLRDDQSTEAMTQKQALSNAPDANSDYFKVPRFMDKS